MLRGDPSVFLPFLLCHTVWRGQRSQESRAFPRETCDARVTVFSDNLQMCHPRTSASKGYRGPQLQWFSALQTSLYYLLLPHPSKCLTTPPHAGCIGECEDRVSEVPGRRRVCADGGVWGTFQVGGTSQRSTAWSECTGRRWVRIGLVGREEKRGGRYGCVCVCVWGVGGMELEALRF